MMKFLKNLNPDQLNAVQAEKGIVRVLAAAGTGKTTTLTAKIAYEIEKGMKPEKIIALTFTKKAGSELKMRLRSLVGAKADNVFTGTFHSFAHQHLSKILTYSVINDDDIYDILKTLLEDYQSVPYKIDELMKMISYHRNTQKPYKDPLVANLEQDYKKFKIKNKLKDFDDLIVDFLSLLKEDFFKFNFELVLTDESQDSNIVQNQIVKHLIKQNRNVFIVGDANQSIYLFRGAAPKEFYAWGNDGCKDYPLTFNYRSTNEVLKVANKILKGMNTEDDRLKIEIKNPKSPVDAPKAKLVKVGNAADEINYVIQRIRELKAKGYSYESMAILYRSHYYSQNLQLKLQQEGIPITVWSGQNVLNAKHIQDVMAFLRAYINKTDLLAWSRILSLLPKVGKKTAATLALTAANQGIGNVEHPSVFPVKKIFEHNNHQDFFKSLESFYIPYIKSEYPQEHRDLATIKFLSYIKAQPDVRKAISDLLFENKDEKEMKGATLTTVHQCVVPETLVETPLGIFPISDIEKSGLINTPTGVKEYTGKFTREKSKVLKITTKSGYSLTVTQDHGLTSWSNGEWLRKNADQLKIGDYLRLRVGSSLEPNNYIKLNLPRNGYRNENKSFKIPNVLDENLAELLGLLVGDGTLWERGFRITKFYQSTINRAAELCSILFNVTPHKFLSKGTLPAVEVNSTYVTRWLKEEFDGLLPRQKNIPTKILQSPFSVQKAFLRGLFEDGTINVKDGAIDHICLTQKVEEIIVKVQYLLLRIGIISTISLNRDYKGGFPQSFLYIYGESIRKFASEIGSVSLEKQNILKCNSYGTDQNRVHLMKKPDVIDIKRFATIYDYQNVRSRGYLSRSKIKDLDPEDLNWLHEKIVDIKEDLRETMCVEVPQGNRFLQNGFDGWNSKGLEWDNVFVIGLYDGVFPNLRNEDIQEEVRLFYVAVTRAKTNLYCLFPEVSNKSQKTNSMFYDLILKTV